jgi:1-acyl-sn-glycerol-3-phosphate acyltransferase
MASAPRVRRAPSKPDPAARSQFALLATRRFLPFFVTQFSGAFNDNVFRNALAVLIAFGATTGTSLSSDTLINLSAALFILPFFLFSALAGQVADKFEKSRLIRGIKLLEILIMLAAAAAFLTGSTPALIFTLFLMGTQSTLFGPLKFGLLPQHLADSELVGGNALVESGTFLAILLGQIAGTVLIGSGAGGPALTGAALIAIAVVGWLASRAIPQAPAADPELRIRLNPFVSTWQMIEIARRDRTIFLAVLGISWFWFLGSVFLTQIPGYTRDYLGGGPPVVTLLLTLFSIGIRVGSLACERLSGHRIEIGLVPLGSIGLTVFGIDVFLARPDAVGLSGLTIAEVMRMPGSVRVAIDLVLIGVFGGLYIVPLYAMVLQRSPSAERSRIIAANNILNALFVVAAAALAILVLGHGFTIPQLLLATAVLNALVAIYIYTLVPEFLMRFIVWVLVNTLYRLRTRGLEAIPDAGPALLVSNHVSFMDALVIGGSVRRPVRFVMDHQIFRNPLLSFIFRTAKAIPIAPRAEDPGMLEAAYERVDAELAEGRLVCLFPEGKLTSDGKISPFRRGIERILERRPVPVVPLALRGLWGSFFSRRGGAAMSRWPRRFWSRIELVAGSAITPGNANASTLEAAVRALRGDWK